MEDIKIPERVLIASMKRFLDEVDYDELARLAGEMYGGTCFLNPYHSPYEDRIFDFTPDENYYGEFDALIKPEENIILEPVEKEEDDNA